MNYWLHRISHHAEVSYQLLDRNYLTIGFSDFSNHDFINNVLKYDTWEERWKELERIFMEKWGCCPRIRHNLWRFIEGFKKGDWIIVPGGGVFSIYEIVGEKPIPVSDLSFDDLKDWHGNPLVIDEFIYRGEEEIDLGFCWKVKPIETNISRYNYADAPLTARMKIRQTNANIFDLEQSIKKAFNAFIIKKPINLHSKILEASIDNILATLKSELNPDKLELLVKFYFERIGASEVYIPSKNEPGKEGDADVIAIFEHIKTIIYIQAKFHGGKTNEWALQQIKDYKDDKESVNKLDKEVMDDDYSRISWVISTADGYTDEAYKLAREEKIQLIDGKKFVTLLLEAGITNLYKNL